MDITVDEYKKHLKNPDKNDIKNYIDDYTSDQDFREYFGNSIDKNIIIYSDLKNYDHITQLLKNNGDFKIILFEQERNSGHWCLMIRYNTIIEWFDSYGKSPTFSLTYSQSNNKLLDQYPEYLNNLLINQDKFTIIYNTYQFQNTKNFDIATCGKWIIMRIIMFKYYKYDLSQFINWFINQKKKYKKLSNDQIITHLIPLDPEEINK